MNYNLVEENWIPVLWRNGGTGRVGIREALTKAEQIRQISATNPMDRVAIARFLLALLYWCKGTPSTSGEHESQRHFPAGWFSKLDSNKSCFNLLGQGSRFYQDRSANRRRAVTDLLQEIPTGNNFAHFRHTTDEEDGLCLTCCTLGLLRLPLFSVSGLPDLKSGINGTPPIYVMPQGNTLRDTLLYNWHHRGPLGSPAWTPDASPTSMKENVPMLAGLTSLSRRVWLHDPGLPGLCIGCGTAQTAIIRTCEFQKATAEELGNWVDPHVIYSEETPRKSQKAPDLTKTGKFKLDRPWADMHALVAGRMASFEPTLSILVVGFATDKAKNIDVWERSVTVPTETTLNSVVMDRFQHWQQGSFSMERKLGRSKGDGKTSIALIRPHVENRVSTRAHELMSGSEDAWAKAAAEYRAMMLAIAKSLSPGYTTAALKRRAEIAIIAPSIGAGSEKASKPRRKKPSEK